MYRFTFRNDSVYLPLCKLADTPFHIKKDNIPLHVGGRSHVLYMLVLADLRAIQIGNVSLYFHDLSFSFHAIVWWYSIEVGHDINYFCRFDGFTVAVWQ